MKPFRRIPKRLSDRCLPVDRDIPEMVDPQTIRGALPVERRQPERALYAAVIQQALEDEAGSLQGAVTNSRAEAERVRAALQASALEWLTDVEAGNAHAGATVSLAYCCDVLGWSADALAKQVRARQVGKVLRTRYAGRREQMARRVA